MAWSERDSVSTKVPSKSNRTAWIFLRPADDDTVIDGSLVMDCCVVSDVIGSYKQSTEYFKLKRNQMQQGGYLPICDAVEQTT